MFCKNCGTLCDDRTEFCPKCGAPMNARNNQNSVINFANKQANNQANNFANNTSNNFVGQQMNNSHNGYMQYQRHHWNYIALVAGILLIISMFMPFLENAFNISSSFMDAGKDGDAILFLILGFVAALFGALGKNKWVVIITGAIATLLSFMEAIYISEQIAESEYYLTKGSGFYLMIASSVLILCSEVIMDFINKQR